MIFRVLDIETVADYSCWTRGRTRYDLAPRGDGSVGLDEVDVVPPPQACRVVAMACVDVLFEIAANPKYRLDSYWTACRWAHQDEAADAEEKALLEAFAHAMETSSDVHLVTWNGRGFDLPVIVMRSLKHKVAAPWYYKSRDVRYRYSTEGHLDLMDFMADYGASRSMRLGDVARLCGLPGKTDMAGDQVAVLHARAGAEPGLGDALRARVAGYCLQDVLQTALVFVRTRHLLGKVTAETHDAVAATFRDKVGADVLPVDWSRFMLLPGKELGDGERA